MTMTKMMKRDLIVFEHERFELTGYDVWMTVEKIGNKLFKAFGMDPIVYTRTYINIKNRNSKDGYRTYFLTKLRNAMEQRIDNDIRKSLRR